MNPALPAGSLADVPQVDSKSTLDRWQAGEIGVLDVREPSEWDLGHIEGVHLIPLGELQSRWRELDSGKQWVVVCRSGNRSNFAALFLRRLGVDAQNLKGGMLDWQKRKLPITPPGIVESR